MRLSEDLHRRATPAQIEQAARLPVHISHIKLGTIGVWGRVPLMNLRRSTRWRANSVSWKMEEAARKMTSLPAALLGLKDRGTIRQGMRAYLVLLRCRENNRPLNF